MFIGQKGDRDYLGKLIPAIVALFSLIPAYFVTNSALEFYHAPFRESYRDILSVAVSAVIGALIYGLSHFFYENLCKTWRRIILSRQSPPQKIAVVLAQLNRDEDQSHRDNIRSSLQEQFGESLSIREIDESVSLATTGVADANMAEAQKNGQRLLNLYKGNVLIWGNVVSTDKVISLHFVGPIDDSQNEHRYALTEKLLLPVDLGKELAPAIAASVAIVAANAHTEGRYTVPLLLAAEAKLRLLIDETPAVLPTETQAVIHFTYALVCQNIADKNGNTEMLKTAMMYYRVALRVYTEADMPATLASLIVHGDNSPAHRPIAQN